MKQKFDPLKWENHESLAAKHSHLITTFQLSDFEEQSEEEPFNLEAELPKDRMQRIASKRLERKA